MVRRGTNWGLIIALLACFAVWGFIIWNFLWAWKTFGPS